MMQPFTGDFAFLSNFYIDGLPGKTVEHRFQSQKSLDPREQDFVLSASTPGEAKRLGRRVTLRGDWEEVKVSVMERLLREKFKQPHLAEKLLMTGSVELIEWNTWNDTFWGVSTKTHRGENRLGNLLMKIRRELRVDPPTGTLW